MWDPILPKTPAGPGPCLRPCLCSALLHRRLRTSWPFSEAILPPALATRITSRKLPTPPGGFWLLCSKEVVLSNLLEPLPLMASRYDLERGISSSNTLLHVKESGPTYRLLRTLPFTVYGSVTCTGDGTLECPTLCNTQPVRPHRAALEGHLAVHIMLFLGAT